MKKQVKLALAGAAGGVASLVAVTHSAAAQQAPFPNVAQGINTWMSRAMDQCAAPTTGVTTAGSPTSGCIQSNSVSTRSGSRPSFFARERECLFGIRCGPRDLEVPFPQDRLHQPITEEWVIVDDRDLRPAAVPRPRSGPSNSTLPRSFRSRSQEIQRPRDLTLIDRAWRAPPACGPTSPATTPCPNRHKCC